jgi:hypothetical protein
MTICITISLVKGNKGSSHITQDGRGRRNDTKCQILFELPLN